MKTDERLNDAYKNARVEYFDDSSKFVIFSDCHRGIGNLSDDFTRNRRVFLSALEHYHKNGFVYIEAGDGDELWECTSFEPNKLSHFEVYETIKKFHDDGRLIMLYGNHNIYLKDQNYVEKNYYSYFDEYSGKTCDFLDGLKPCEALLLKHKDTGQEVFVVHGHQGDLANDQLWPLAMFSTRHFWRHLHAFGIQNPASPAKNVSKRHKIEKNFNKWIARNGIMLICGHTHRFKFPRPGELPYFNTGCCVYPTTITGIEIENGNIQLVRWQVLGNEDGYLRVTRKALGASNPIKSFDMKRKPSE